MTTNKVLTVPSLGLSSLGEKLWTLPLQGTARRKHPSGVPQWVAGGLRLCPAALGTLDPWAFPSGSFLSSKLHHPSVLTGNFPRLWQYEAKKDQLGSFSSKLIFSP